MSLLFNYYFGNDVYNSGNGSTTLNDRFTSGRTSRNATLKKNQGASMTTRTTPISNNYDTDSPYSSGIGNNTATHSFKPDPQGNDGNKCSFYEHQLSTSFEDTSFTICSWVKMGSSSTTSDRDTFFASGVRGENNSTTFQLGIYKVSNSIFQLILNINETDNNKYFEITPDNVDYRGNSNWQFVAVTYSYDDTLANREIKTYIFSDLSSTTPDYSNTYTSTTGSGNKNKILSEYDFKFTTYRFGTNRQVQKYWTGSIGASRGYNYVLSQSQITNIFQYNSLDGTTAGDPHITTLYGINYKFDYLGYFRMLDNNSSNDNQRILINGLSEYGEGLRWKDNQYVRKIFIYQCGKYAIIDTGFRGSKAKVIENNGLDIEESDLDFNKKAKIHCFDCNRSINYNCKNIIKKHINKYNHKLLNAVRNNIKIKIKNDSDEITINISNVNQYNLQPCRISITPIKISINNYTGTYIHRRYALNSKINNLKSLDFIKHSKKNSINLPKLERRPELLNEKFV